VLLPVAGPAPYRNNNNGNYDEGSNINDEEGQQQRWRMVGGGHRAVALDLLEREEPQLLFRRFSHPSSSPVLSPSSSVLSSSWFGSWSAVAVCNWDWRERRRRVTLQLPADQNAAQSAPIKGGDENGKGHSQYFHVLEFWSGRYQRIHGTRTTTTTTTMTTTAAGAAATTTATTPSCSSSSSSSDLYYSVDLGSFGEEKLPPHSALLFLVRPVHSAIPIPPIEDSNSNSDSDSDSSVRSTFALPQFLGSSIHFSGGVEVRPGSWDYRQLNDDNSDNHGVGGDKGSRRLDFVLDVERNVPADARAHIWLYLPSSSSSSPSCSEEAGCCAPVPTTPIVSGSAFEAGDGSLVRVVGDSSPSKSSSSAPSPSTSLPSSSSPASSTSSAGGDDDDDDDDDDTAKVAGGGWGVWRIGVAFGAQGGSVRVKW